MLARRGWQPAVSVGCAGQERVDELGNIRILDYLIVFNFAARYIAIPGRPGSSLRVIGDLCCATLETLRAAQTTVPGDELGPFLFRCEALRTLDIHRDVLGWCRELGIK